MGRPYMGGPYMGGPYMGRPYMGRPSAKAGGGSPSAKAEVSGGGRRPPRVASGVFPGLKKIFPGLFRVLTRFFRVLAGLNKNFLGFFRV